MNSKTMYFFPFSGLIYLLCFPPDETCTDPRRTRILFLLRENHLYGAFCKFSEQAFNPLIGLLYLVLFFS